MFKTTVISIKILNYIRTVPNLGNVMKYIAGNWWLKQHWMRHGTMRRHSKKCGRASCLSKCLYVSLSTDRWHSTGLRSQGQVSHCHMLQEANRLRSSCPCKQTDRRYGYFSLVSQIIFSPHHRSLFNIENKKCTLE